MTPGLVDARAQGHGQQPHADRAPSHPVAGAERDDDQRAHLSAASRAMRPAATTCATCCSRSTSPSDGASIHYNYWSSNWGYPAPTAVWAWLYNEAKFAWEWGEVGTPVGLRLRLRQRPIADSRLHRQGRCWKKPRSPRRRLFAAPRGGQRTVILSTDLAHSLADSLDVDSGPSHSKSPTTCGPRRRTPTTTCRPTGAWCRSG